MITTLLTAAVILTATPSTTSTIPVPPAADLVACAPGHGGENMGDGWRCLSDAIQDPSGQYIFDLTGKLIQSYPPVVADPDPTTVMPPKPADIPTQTQTTPQTSAPAAPAKTSAPKPKSTPAAAVPQTAAAPTLEQILAPVTAWFEDLLRALSTPEGTHIILGYTSHFGGKMRAI